MEPSIEAEQLWKNLVAGGTTASDAIADFAKMPELKRDALVAQLFARAEGYMNHLIDEERQGNRVTFRGSKDDFLNMLEALPALLTTPEARRDGIKKVEAIDCQAAELTNIDILMKCDEVVTQLKKPHGPNLDGLTMVTCGSLEELKAAFAKEIPPEVLEQIGRDGDALLFGIIIKKKPE